MNKLTLGTLVLFLLLMSNGCALTDAYNKASKRSSMNNNEIKSHNIEVLKKECEGADKMAREMGLESKRQTVEECIQQGLKDSGFN